MNRRLPALAVVIVVTAACGAADDDAAGSTSTSEPTPTTAATSTTAPPASATPTIAPPTATPPVKDTTPDDLAPPTSPEDPVTNPSTPPIGSNVDLAIADLAARLDVDASVVEVVSVEEVTWPDGSLGCPRPGMSYTQALVDGQLIVLEVDGTEYEYHSGRSGDPFYCPADRATPPAAGGYGDT